MTKEELININGIREDLYQAMQIGDITLSSKDSQKLVDFMNYQDKEIERLHSIIKEVREYIEEHLEREYFDYDILEANTIYNRDLYKVLKILDKGSDSNE